MFNQPIGVIDSGVGGFSTCLEIQNVLPNESIINYGDLYYMPYGQKTQEFLTARIKSIISHLENNGAKAIVIACNTASTALLNHPEIFSHIKIPIFNVISSMLDYLKNHIKNTSQFTVLATKATIDSKIYEQKLHYIFPNTEVKSIAAIEWASLVETVALDSPEMVSGLGKYIPLIENTESNTVLLACTHFYYLEEILQSKIPKANFINTSTPVVKDLKQYLDTHNLNSNKKLKHRALASQTSDFYIKMAKNTLGRDIEVQISEIPL